LTLAARAAKCEETLGAAQKAEGDTRALFAEVIAACDSFIADDPKSAYAWSLRGDAEEQLERIDAAIESQDKASAADPHYWPAHDRLAEVLTQKSEHEGGDEAGFARALAEWDRALALAPYGGARAAVHLHRGAALSRRRGLLMALPDYRAGLHCALKGADKLRDDLLIIVLDVRLDEARAQREKAEARMAESVALNDEGAKHDGLVAAAALFERYLELAPDDATALADEAECFQVADEYAKARDAYARVIALRPDDVRAYFCKGDLERELVESRLRPLDGAGDRDIGDADRALLEASVADLTKSLELSGDEMGALTWAVLRRAHARAYLRELDAAQADLAAIHGTLDEMAARRVPLADDFKRELDTVEQLVGALRRK
jgi:tetratricopeptide (TPR) repeat protein